jgi:hypothetical protein
MTTAAMPRRSREEVNAEYRERMIVNAVAATFVSFLIAAGYWIVSTMATVFVV